MKQKPNKNKGNLFKGITGFHILCSAVYVCVCSLVLYCVCAYVFKYSTLEIATICFLFICLTEQIHTYNLKSETESLFSKNPFDNKILNIGFAVSLVLTILIAAVPMPTIQNALGITTISWQQWLFAIGFAVSIVPFYEIVKFFIRIWQKRKKK